MIELLNNLEGHAKKQLEKMNDELDEKGRFVCDAQIDDLKDLVSVIHKIELLKALPSMK